MPDPNNILISKYKTIAMLIPKCANESVKYAFIDALGLNEHPRRAFPTASKEMAGGLRDKGWFVFTIVRNPFDRLVSCWADKLQADKMFKPFKRYGLWHKMTFDAFIERIAQMQDHECNQHWRPMSYDLLGKGEVVPAFVGRFERLAEDWKVVQERCPVSDLRHANKSNHKPYREHYTPRLRDLVARRYAKDLGVFGYEF